MHGLGVSSRYFVPTLRALAGGFAVEAVDLPGFGRSPKPAEVLDIDGLAAALAGYLRATGPGAVTLLANSLGCQIAVACAVREAELVDRLVLVGPTTDPVARSGPAQAWRWIANAQGESPLQLPLLVLDYAEAGLRRAGRTFRLSLRDRIEVRLPAVAQPTLVVRGERDRIVPQAWAEEVTRLLPRGRLAVVPGAAHTVNFTHPEDLGALVAPFVGSA